MSLKILYEVTIYRPLDFKNKILINHEMDEIEKIIFQLKQESSFIMGVRESKRSQGHACGNICDDKSINIKA